MGPSLVPTTPILQTQPTLAPTPTTTKKGKKQAKEKAGESNKDLPVPSSAPMADGIGQSMSATPAKKTVKQSKKSDTLIAQSTASPTPGPAAKDSTSTDSPTVPSKASKKGKKASTAHASPDTPSTSSSGSPAAPRQHAKADTSIKTQTTALPNPVPNPVVSTPAPTPAVKQPKDKRARKSSAAPIVGKATIPSPESSSVKSATPSPTVSVAEGSAPTMTESQKKAKKEKRRNKRKGSHESTPNSSEGGNASPTQSAPSTPSPHLSLPPKSHIALKFADRYKPARPSPLRSTTADDSPSTSSPPIKNKRRRDRKRLRESINANGTAAFTPGSAEASEMAGTSSVQAEKQTTSTAPELTPDQTSPPRKKPRQETSTPSKVSKSQNRATNQDTMQAKRIEAEPTGTADEPMTSAPAATTSDRPQTVSDAPKSPKKIVPLSAEYDLYRKPNDNGESQSSNESTSRGRPSSNEYVDVDMEEPSTAASEVLVPETVEDVLPTGNADVVPETLHAPATATDLPTSLSSADIADSEGAAPAAESLATSKPTQQVLTPKKKPPRGRKLAETPKTKANGDRPTMASAATDLDDGVPTTNSDVVEGTESAPAPTPHETSDVNNHTGKSYRLRVTTVS